jgi:hypothetical protein
MVVREDEDDVPLLWSLSGGGGEEVAASHRD